MALCTVTVGSAEAVDVPENAGAIFGTDVGYFILSATAPSHELGSCGLKVHRHRAYF